MRKFRVFVAAISGDLLYVVCGVWGFLFIWVLIACRVKNSGCALLLFLFLFGPFEPRLNKEPCENSAFPLRLIPDCCILFVCFVLA